MWLVWEGQPSLWSKELSQFSHQLGLDENGPSYFLSYALQSKANSTKN